MSEAPFSTPPTPPPSKTAPVQEKETYWRGHLECWRASGLSQSAYSREHGLRPNQLSYWHRREQRLTTEEGLASAGSFIPLQVVAEVESKGLSVRLPGGAVVEGVTAVNVEVVRQLLVAL